jgi:hypothetical protein
MPSIQERVSSVRHELATTVDDVERVHLQLVAVARDAAAVVIPIATLPLQRSERVRTFADKAVEKGFAALSRGVERQYSPLHRALNGRAGDLPRRPR